MYYDEQMRTRAIHHDNSDQEFLEHKIKSGMEIPLFFDK
jgi:hypothetical protein